MLNIYKSNSRQWGFVSALILFLSAAVVRAEKQPDCALDVEDPVPAESSCQCYGEDGTAQFCPDAFVQPNLSSINCNTANSSVHWGSSKLKLFAYDESTQQLVPLPKNNNRTIVPFSHDYKVSVFYADLLSPPSYDPGACVSDPNFAIILRCDEVGYELRLGKHDDFTEMETILDKGTVWTTNLWWAEALATINKPGKALMSNHYEFQCLKLPNSSAQKKLKFGKAYMSRVLPWSNNQADNFVKYIPVTLVHHGVAAPAVTQFNLKDNKIAKGESSTGKFKIENRGQKAIVKAIARIIASPKANVTKDDDPLAMETNKGEWFGLGVGGSLVKLQQDDPVASAKSKSADKFQRIEAGDDPFAYSLNEIYSPADVVHESLEPGETIDLHFSAEVIVVRAEQDAPSLPSSVYPPDVDKITFKPIAKVRDLILESPQPGGSGLPEFSLGSTLNFNMTIENASAIPTHADTVLKIKVKKTAGANGGKTIAQIPLGSLPGNSTMQLNQPVVVNQNPSGFLKANKNYHWEAVITKYRSDDPKKAGVSNTVKTKYFGFDGSLGLGFDTNHDGVITAADTGLVLIALNEHDDNQNDVPDNAESFDINDPDGSTATVLFGSCSSAGGWYLDYPLGSHDAATGTTGNIKVYDVDGNVIVPQAVQPCPAGDLAIVYLHGTVLSDVANDVTIDLWHTSDGIVSPTFDDHLDTLDATVFRVDMLMDSNNDEVPENYDDSCENVIGAIPAVVMHNQDDDDGNGTADLSDAGPVPGEDNLAAMGIRIKPQGLADLLQGSGYQFKISSSNSSSEDVMRMWQLPTKSQQLRFPYEIGVIADSDLIGGWQFGAFIEGVIWTDDASELKVKLMNNGATIGRDIVKTYVGTPMVLLPGVSQAGDSMMAFVSGFPVGTQVLMEVYVDGVLDPLNPPQVVEIDEYLLAGMTVTPTFPGAPGIPNTPGAVYHVVATIQDTAGCTQMTLTSDECVIEPGSADELRVETLNICTQGDGSTEVDFVVTVEDAYQNPIDDTVVIAQLSNGSGQLITPGVVQTDLLGTAFFTAKLPAYDGTNPFWEQSNFEMTFYTHGASKVQTICLDPLEVTIAPVLDELSPPVISVASATSVNVFADAADGTSVYWFVRFGDGSTAEFETDISLTVSTLELTPFQAPAGVCDIVAVVGNAGRARTRLRFDNGLPYGYVEKPWIAGDKTTDGTWIFTEQWTNPGIIPEITDPILELVHQEDYAALTPVVVLDANPGQSFTVNLEDVNDYALVSFDVDGVTHTQPFQVTAGANGIASFVVKSAGIFHKDNEDYENYFTNIDELNWGVKDIFITVTDDQTQQQVFRDRVQLSSTDTIGLVKDFARASVGFAPDTLGGDLAQITIPVAPDVGTLTLTGYWKFTGSDERVNEVDSWLAAASLGASFTPLPASLIKMIRALLNYVRRGGEFAQKSAIAIAKAWRESYLKWKGVDGFAGASSVTDQVDLLIHVVTPSGLLLDEPNLLNAIVAVSSSPRRFHQLVKSRRLVYEELGTDASFIDNLRVFGEFISSNPVDANAMSAAAALAFNHMGTPGLSPGVLAGIVKAISESDRVLTELAIIAYYQQQHLPLIGNILARDELYTTSWKRSDFVHDLALATSAQNLYTITKLEGALVRLLQETDVAYARYEFRARKAFFDLFMTEIADTTDLFIYRADEFRFIAEPFAAHKLSALAELGKFRPAVGADVVKRSGAHDLFEAVLYLRTKGDWSGMDEQAFLAAAKSINPEKLPAVINIVTPSVAAVPTSIAQQIARLQDKAGVLVNILEVPEP